MNKDVTFLVTYFAQPDLMRICLDSIKRYHPDARIVVSQQVGDGFVDVGDIKRIEHNMQGQLWVDAAIGLMKECDTKIAVFIEHDAFLLKPLDELIELVLSGEYDMIGPEEVIPFPFLNRNSPGMICQNFFIVNAEKMREFGLEKMRLDHSKITTELKNKESGYGVSQVMEKKLFMPVKESGYGHGTFYGDHVHHLWYGSYRGRNTWVDNVNPMWLDYEAERLVKDYWGMKIKA